MRSEVETSSSAKQDEEVEQYFDSARVGRLTGIYADTEQDDALFRGAVMGGVHPVKTSPYIVPQQELLLTHNHAHSLWQRYLLMTQQVLALPESAIGLSCICPSGTTAVHSVLHAANEYQRALGVERRGVLCSDSSHTSITTWPEMVAAVLNADRQTGQCSTEDVLSGLEERAPAVLFLTAGRTDDGEVEQLDKRVESYCLQHNIPIALDASAGSLFPLLPDKPCSYLPEHQTERVNRYHRLIESEAVKFVVGGLGKFVGPLGLGAVFLKDSEKTGLLYQASANSWDQDHEWEYYATNGSFGGKTIGASIVERALDQFENLQMWRLKMFALHAYQAASDISQDLQGRGIRALDATTHSVRIPVSSKEMAIECTQRLHDDHMVEAALVSFPEPGIRVSLNVGYYYCDAFKRRLSDRLYEVIGGEKYFTPVRNEHYRPSGIKGSKTTSSLASQSFWPRMYWKPEQYNTLDAYYKISHRVSLQQDALSSESEFLTRLDDVTHMIESATGISLSALRYALRGLEVDGDRVIPKDRKVFYETLNHFLWQTKHVERLLRENVELPTQSITHLSQQTKECYLITCMLARDLRSHSGVKYVLDTTKSQERLFTHLKNFEQLFMPVYQAQLRSAEPFVRVDEI